MTLSSARVGLEFKMVFINWRGVEEVGVEIDMKLRTENRYKRGNDC